MLRSLVGSEMCIRDRYGGADSPEVSSKSPVVSVSEERWEAMCTLQTRLEESHARIEHKLTMLGELLVSHQRVHCVDAAHTMDAHRALVPDVPELVTIPRLEDSDCVNDVALV
eukprot:TRINITY_DN39110_c0_g1_i1.p1 TRINITY_DN39110_c0_g1~~TRINITY_DN39110_c0_g1_i1.p1  ORF type:complete len:113 (+),score=20.95 TRINITY_DN39110_c0_g1_i1:79-417(+)